jgi:hypothetical protein
LTATVIGYAAVGPFITLYRIRTALERQDPEQLSQNIDFPTLRQNLKEQLSALLMKEMAVDMRDNPFGGLALALGPRLVDGMIDSFVTPSGLASLIEGKASRQFTTGGAGASRAEPNPGQNPSALTPPKAPPPPSEPAYGKRGLFRGAQYGYDSTNKFSVWLDTEDGQHIRLVLTRDGLSWRLTNIVLPDVFRLQRIESNEESAVSSLRIINTAQVTYWTIYNLGYCAGLSRLGPSPTGTPSLEAAGLVDSELAAGFKDGYRFTYLPGEADRQDGSVRAYTLRADPVQPGQTGNRHYFTDQTGIIRLDVQNEANANSPPVTTSTQ